MKLYKNLVNASAETLQAIFRDKRHADKAIEWQFKHNTKWGSRDRKFVAESVYDIVRFYRLYAHVAQSENNFWFMVMIWALQKGYELPDWQEFKTFNPVQIHQAWQRASDTFVVKESYPDWLYERIKSELGEDLAEQELRAMNLPASVYLRVNTLLCSKQQCIDALNDTGIVARAVEGNPTALKLEKREQIFKHPLFKKGWFEVQDAGSQQIGEFVAAKPGLTIIDACAGAGGKSLQLAAATQNKGRIISMDIEGWKLDELKKRAKRATAHNIETRLIEGPKSIKTLSERADILLLDVPCSGTGVIRRNPDAKWKLSELTIAQTHKVQSEILENYSAMLKQGGKLIYSTCSILPSENEQIVAEFLKNNNDFLLLEEKTILPSSGFDGFYMARMEKRAI